MRVLYGCDKHTTRGVVEVSEFPSKWRCGLSGWPQAKAAPAAPTAETAEAERGAPADTSVAHHRSMSSHDAVLLRQRREGAAA